MVRRVHLLAVVGARPAERGSGVPSEERQWLETTWSAEEPAWDRGRFLPALDRFRVEALLGEGAWGQVYRAFDRLSLQPVALKVRRSACRPSDLAIARLRRELRATRRIHHPGVLRSHEIFEHGEQLALSMELVEGQTLSARIAAAPMPARELDRLARALAAALSAIHRAGIVHRDLKPSNVMLRDAGGAPVLMDFGAARLDDGEVAPSAPTGRASSLTETGAVLGTPLYMAPEQLAAGRARPVADVYAFGLILWEAAVGKRPHRAGTIDELYALRCGGCPPGLGRLRPDLPAGLVALIARCLEPDAERRPEDGAALVRAFADVAGPSLGGSAASAFATAMAGLAVLALVAGC